MQITVSDVDGLLLLTAVFSIVAIPVQMLGTECIGSNRLSTEALAMVVATILLQIYNGLMENVNEMQFDSGEYQLYVWLFLFVAITAVVQYFFGVAVWILAACLLTVGVGSSFGAGVDAVNSAFGINITTNDLAIFWVVMLVLSLLVGRACERWLWVCVATETVVYSAIFLIDIHVLMMYMTQSQSSYVLLDFALLLLYQFLAVLILVGAVNVFVQCKQNKLQKERARYQHVTSTLEEFVEKGKQHKKNEHHQKKHHHHPHHHPTPPHFLPLPTTEEAEVEDL
jgi:hypothetical protein